MESGVVDILILGAGLAGLGAAIQIKNTKFKKCSYLILEAQDQAGGRVKSDKLKEFARNQNHKKIETEKSPQKNAVRKDFVDGGNFMYFQQKSVIICIQLKNSSNER